MQKLRKSSEKTGNLPEINPEQKPKNHHKAKKEGCYNSN